MVANQRHPNQSASRQSKGEDLRKPKRHALVDESLAGEVAQRYNICPVCNVVNRAQSQMVGRVAAHNGRNERPGTKESASKRRQLVGGFGICLWSWDELVNRVIGVKFRRRWWKLCVSDEATVVETPREVKCRVCLQTIANGDDRELFARERRVSITGPIDWQRPELRLERTTSM